MCELMQGPVVTDNGNLILDWKFVAEKVLVSATALALSGGGGVYICDHRLSCSPDICASLIFFRAKTGFSWRLNFPASQVTIELGSWPCELV